MLILGADSIPLCVLVLDQQVLLSVCALEDIHTSSLIEIDTIRYDKTRVLRLEGVYRWSD